MLRYLTGLAAVAALATSTPAHAQSAYVVGLSGALTGPAAATYAAAIEGLRLHIETVNGRGGVNGKPIQLIIYDDQAEPSKSAANVRRLLTQDNVILLIHASLSATYPAAIGEVKRAKVPLMFSGSICPKEVYPPADEVQFCTTAFGSQYESRMALGYVKEAAGGAPVKLATTAMAIPLSRAEMEYAEQLAPSLGMTVVDKQVTPPATADYTPFATKMKEAGPNWVYTSAPWISQVRNFEALRRLGWDGRYITTAHAQAEDELARIKDEGLYVFGANALFQDELPAHQEIREAAKKAGTNLRVTELTEGWVAGMALEAVLKATPWPPTGEKVFAAMRQVKVDTKGLRGGPLEWTADNHFRAAQYYRVWHWDNAQQKIVRVKDWTRFDIKAEK